MENLLQPEAYEQTLLGRIDRRVFAAPAARWMLLILAGLLLAVPSVQFIDKIQETEYSIFRGREKHRSAVGRWMGDVGAVQEGGDPYGLRHWFPNPPLVLISLLPFGELPIVLTGLIWSYLKVVAVVGGCLLVLASARQGAAIPVGVLLVVALFSVRPIMGDITHGNINIFVFFEIALSWYLFVEKRDFLAGLVLGLAVVTKVTPGLLLVYFLYKRAWRVLSGTGIGLVVFAIVIPGVVLGFERNFELLGGWFNLMIRPYVLEGFVTIEPKNQSIPGTILRLFGYPRSEQLPAKYAKYIELLAPLNWIELKQLSIEQAKMFAAQIGQMAAPATLMGKAILRGAGILLVLALAWLCRTPLTQRRDPRLLLEISLVLIAMLLLSERTWKHHLTTLPIIYLATWGILAGQVWSTRFRVVFVAGLLLQLLFLVVLRGDISLFAGAITWGLILCFIQNAVLLRGLNVKSEKATG